MSTAKIETKDTLPKIEPNPFAAFTAFDPFAFWTQSQQAFAKMMSDNVGRAQQYADQYTAFENMMLQRTQQAVATWAQLTQDAIAYSGQLSQETRRLGLDAIKKMGFTA